MDDLNAPLGQRKARKPRFTLPFGKVPVSPAQAAAGVLGLFIAAVAGWALTVDDPLGGEPVVVVAAGQAPDPAAATAVGNGSAAGSNSQRRTDAAGGGAAAIPGADAPGARTVNIIDGVSGKSQQIVLPPSGEAGSAAGTAAGPHATIDRQLLEKTRHGEVPRIGANGARPSAVYARPLRLPPGKADTPRIALIVTGLGISTRATNEALARMPGPVSFAFTPYGSEVDALVSRARLDGHEVLLQAPMEPLDYPDNDPGPQALLTSLSADQNVDRLQWLMSRFQGFVGIANYMGGRFTASEQALGPVLREAAKRGLIYVDDGTSPRSVAGQLSGINNIPFAKAEVVIDAVPTAAEIDRALGRLEAQARERGVAVGTLSALPLAVARVADWARKVESRGFVLVPITAVAVKAKSS